MENNGTMPDGGKVIAELRIYKAEDRKLVAGILFENGYSVRQGKQQKTPTGKSVDYTVIVVDYKGIEKR